MTQVVRGNWAGAYCNDKFICLKTYSGYRGGTHPDPKGSQHLLSINVSDEELGLAVFDTLEHSRFVLPAPQAGSTYPADLEFDPELYDYKLTAQRHADWTRELIEKYMYKSRRALFDCMKNCRITRQGDLIKIEPTHHEILDAWSGDGISEEDLVVISASNSADELGKALRLAFDRCTG